MHQTEKTRKMRTDMRKIGKIAGFLLFLGVLLFGGAYFWLISQQKPLAEILPEKTTHFTAWEGQNEVFSVFPAFQSHFSKGYILESEEKTALLVPLGAKSLAQFRLGRALKGNTPQFTKKGLGFRMYQDEIAPFYAGFRDGWAFLSLDEAFVDDFLTQTPQKEPETHLFLEKTARNTFSYYGWWDLTLKKALFESPLTQITQKGTWGLQKKTDKRITFVINLLYPSDPRQVTKNPEYLNENDLRLLQYLPYEGETLFLGKNLAQKLKTIQENAETVSPAHKTAFLAWQKAFFAPFSLHFNELSTQTLFEKPVALAFSEKTDISTLFGALAKEDTLEKQKIQKENLIAVLKEIYRQENPVLDTILLPDGSTRQEFVLSNEKNVPLSEKNVENIPVIEIGQWILAEKENAWLFSNNKVAFYDWQKEITPQNVFRNQKISQSLQYPFLSASEILISPTKSLKKDILSAFFPKDILFPDFSALYSDIIVQQRFTTDGTALIGTFFPVLDQ